MNQLNCVISYFFQLHLMLHACVWKLDLTAIVKKIWELNAALIGFLKKRQVKINPTNQYNVEHKAFRSVQDCKWISKNIGLHHKKQAPCFTRCSVQASL